jgi:hypothetical protein
VSKQASKRVSEGVGSVGSVGDDGSVQGEWVSERGAEWQTDKHKLPTSFFYIFIFLFFEKNKSAPVLSYGMKRTKVA